MKTSVYEWPIFDDGARLDGVRDAVWWYTANYDFEKISNKLLKWVLRAFHFILALPFNILLTPFIFYNWLCYELSQFRKGKSGFLNKTGSILANLLAWIFYPVGILVLPVMVILKLGQRLVAEAPLVGLGKLFEKIFPGEAHRYSAVPLDEQSTNEQSVTVSVPDNGPDEQPEWHSDNFLTVRFDNRDEQFQNEFFDMQTNVDAHIMAILVEKWLLAIDANTRYPNKFQEISKKLTDFFLKSHCSGSKDPDVQAQNDSEFTNSELWNDIGKSKNTLGKRYYDICMVWIVVWQLYENKKKLHGDSYEFFAHEELNTLLTDRDSELHKQYYHWFNDYLNEVNENVIETGLKNLVTMDEDPANAEHDFSQLPGYQELIADFDNGDALFRKEIFPALHTVNLKLDSDSDFVFDQAREENFPPASHQTSLTLDSVDDQADETASDVFFDRNVPLVSQSHGGEHASDLLWADDVSHHDALLPSSSAPEEPPEDGDPESSRTTHLWDAKQQGDTSRIRAQSFTDSGSNSIGVVAETRKRLFSLNDDPAEDSAQVKPPVVKPQSRRSSVGGP